MTNQNSPELDTIITEIRSDSNGYHQLTAFNATVNDKSIKDPAYFSTTKSVTNGADAVDLLDDMMDLQANVTMFRGDNAEAFLESSSPKSLPLGEAAVFSP